MATFFTADLHFGHKNLVRVTSPGIAPKRAGFTSDLHHDEHVIEQWNLAIRPPDQVYVLGDVSFSSHRRTAVVLSLLNGHMHLVQGNHDHGLNQLAREQFEWVRDYYEMDAVTLTYYDMSIKKPELAVQQVKQRIVMCHFPLRSWNKMHYGSWNLHGHSHNTLPPQGKQLDVGLDSAKALLGQYRPFELSEIAQIMGDREVVVVDHHVPREKELYREQEREGAGETR